MPRSKGSGRNKREADYSNIGVAGRKTGITLKDTGIRDKHGLEPLEGVFSSPEKSPVKRNGVPHNSTIEEEEDMDIGHSTIPEPTEVLSARRNGKTIMPPPRARSPIKTTLNSSPRRSMGPMSSPARQSDSTPLRRAASHPLVNRRLDFSMEKPRQSVEISPQEPKPGLPSTTKSAKNSRSNNPLSVASKGRKKAFDLSLTEDEEEEEEAEAIETLKDHAQNDASIDPNMLTNTSLGNDESATFANGDGVNQLFEDEPLQIDGNETLAIEDSLSEGINSYTEEPSRAVKTRRGRPSKSDVAAATLHTQSTKVEARSAPIAPMKDDESRLPVSKKPRERPRAIPAEEKELPAQENPKSLKRRDRATSDTVDQSKTSEQTAKSKAAKPKKAQLEVFHDEGNKGGEGDEGSEDDEIYEGDEGSQGSGGSGGSRGSEGSEGDEDEPRPSKPAKRQKITPAKKTPPKGKRRIAKPPPSERDPNARIVSNKKPKAKAPSKDSSSSIPVKTQSGPRSLYFLRRETPAEDSGARVMRSGRTSVKPVAFWRNERIVYGDINMDGKNLLLPAIKEVIRTDEIIPPKRRRAPVRPHGTASKRRHVKDVKEEKEEEEDGEQDDWEQDPGILPADVVQWNPEHRRGDPETIEEIELAYAPIALQSNTREVRGANFRYAKILTLPFFGSGMVDIPPGGEKRVKNARRMQMVFFVFTGRVTVDVSGTQFSIGKGGMWQVPRGNFYAIANPADNPPARIFFAQGCDVSELEQIPENSSGG